MRLILLFAFLLLSIEAFSQEEAFYIEFNNIQLVKALEAIEDKYNIIFTYNDEYIIDKSLTIEGQKRNLKELISDLNMSSGLNFNIISNRYVMITKQTEDHINVLELITIKSYLTKGIEKNNDGSYILHPDKLEILPGLTEADVLESIQLLPGVLSPNETATGFYVRGGFSDQNRLIWDGINLYHKGHLFGMISPLNPNITSQIQFINKGTNPKYGERLSSVINVTSQKEISDDINGEFGLNGINADALIEIPIIKNKLNVIGSYRRSYTELWETPTFNQLSNKVFESTKINQNENSDNDFYFNDYNLKFNYKPNDNNYFFASLISIDNNLDYQLIDSENDLRFNDLMRIQNTGYSIGWTKNWTSRFTQNIQAFFSDYSFNYSFITSDLDATLSDFEKRNTIYDSGISLDFDYNFSRLSSFSFGYQYTLKDVAYAFLNSADQNFILDFEDRTVQTHALYSNLITSKLKFLDLSIGIRANYFQEIGKIRLEPRVQASKIINEQLSVNATAEIKNQIINEIDETIFSDLSLENNVWRLSDGEEVPIKRSFQSTLGFLYNKKSISLDADFYYKKINDVSALSLGFLNPQNSGFNIGEQTIYGADLFMKKRLNNFNAWVSYSFNSARSLFEDINENRSFKSKTNVTHAVSTALSYKRDGFQFSLGWKWQTGRPFTEFDEIDKDIVFNRGVNTGQLPNYHRLDFSSTYSFCFSKSQDLNAKVGFSIRNLYNRRSLISREYRGNNNLDDPVRVVDRFSLGITPNILFRLYW